MTNNTHMIDFISRGDDKGFLVAIEEDDTIPFSIQRVYYIYGVPGDIRRGFHSHRDLEQVLICVHGSVSILVEDGTSSEVVRLDSPDKGLYIGPMVWREMFDFDNGAVLLVLASRHYDTSDYLRDHEEYLQAAREYFKR